ncbi:hypothetical protein D3093_05295 [Azospirillum argentinense]|uniref:SlyX protein n=1 Tax=Azospirillum argentinense TaxID=2970906 RepID=A0A4D8PHE9_9PROT|nr:hypothetical protein [Azospirillum argentinense]QCN94725.1 hypothetical protein D3093_05295 [Azospirillum argentinense]
MDRESEILSKLDQLIDMQHATQGDIRELKGQMSTMLMWLQSMDQRFSALMAPVNPPRKPAA